MAFLTLAVWGWGIGKTVSRRAGTQADRQVVPCSRQHEWQAAGSRVGLVQHQAVPLYGSQRREVGLGGVALLASKVGAQGGIGGDHLPPGTTQGGSRSKSVLRVA